MRWVDDLEAEHRAVGRMLKVLRAMAARLESGGKVTESDIAASLEFLKVFVDECHHAKEEKLLIPALAAAGVPVASGVVDLVIEEHAEGRHSVSEMRKHAAGMSMGDRGAAAAGFAAEAHGYSSLMERHIVREEAELYPRGEATLDEATQIALADSFDTMERDVIGPGVHEAFHEMLERLALAYGTGES